MPHSPDDRRWPAWVVSVATHSLVLTAALLVLDRRPTGAVEEPGREVGIVIRQQVEQATQYQSELDASTELPAEPVESQALPADARPEASLSTLAQHLPPEHRPLDLQAVGNASQSEDASAGRPRPPGSLAASGKARASVFGVAGEGHKFVYAFDRSVSMTGTPLAAAKQQLLASLESLGRTHQFQILFFNHRLTAFDLTAGRNRIAFANDQTRDAARRFVQGITADGGTDRFQALRRALAMEPDVVFFLTDADDAMTAAELAQIDDLNARVGATICSIEFGRGPSQGKLNFLQQLAKRTGGQYGYVDTTRLLEK